MAEAVQIRLARFDFLDAIRRDNAGIPTIAADDAAEQGPRVVLVDVRPREELFGSLGFVPSSRHVPIERIAELIALGEGARVVLLSNDGRRAGAAARLLELAGMKYVAAVDGGLLSWRAAGLPTTTDPAQLDPTLPADVDALLLPPERTTGALTLEEVTAQVSDAPRVRWVRLAAFLLNGKTACVDGRDSHGVIGTPGGDAGELMLALATVEACGQRVDEGQMPALLRCWLDAFGRFYLHSDVSALNRFIGAMRADPRIAEDQLPKRDAPPSAWRAFVKGGPPAGIRPFVLEHLVNADAIGCGHLKLMLQNAAEYGVRSELVTAFLRAFFEAIWERIPEVEFVALGGAHQEGGVLLVNLDEDLYPYTRVPLVPPAVGGVQLFVHHPQVTGFQRDQVSHWLAERGEWPQLRGRYEDLRRTMNELAERQMQATLARLARGLPIFEATFSSDRSVKVKQVGEVIEATFSSDRSVKVKQVGEVKGAS
jgi:rhodanese-related sulfurtransferase